MSAADRLGSHLDGLSAQDRHRLDSWMQAFGQGWDERRWARSIDRLPADGPLRRPALVEMAKIDLARRWQAGRKIAIDYYVTAHPELSVDGQPSLDLLAAERQVREQFGDDAGPTTLADNHPALAEQRRGGPPVESPRPLPSDTAPPRTVHSAPEAVAAFVRPTSLTFMTAPGERASPRSRPRSRPTTVIDRVTESKPVAPSSAWAWVVGAVVVVGVAVGWFVWVRPAPAPTSDSAPSIVETKPAEPLQPGDPVRTISVTLTVGDKADLTDRVGLDLGIGFPLWLDPIGTDPTRPAPFGAMPQQGPDEPVLKAGAEATFTFAADGDPGKDVLHTSRQLLSGVLVRDLRRIGFIGPVTTDWELAGYELKINGRTIATGTQVSPRKLLDKTLGELAAVGRKLRPLEQKQADLRELVQARLATAAETRELTDLDAALITDTRQRARLEAQVQGKTPWFVAPKVELPPAPESPLIQSARVTVLTRAHEGADTRNYVYIAIGAAKYLLGSPARPLTPAAGPQTFDLDLDAAPIPNDNDRRFSFGMLAHSDRQGDVPDRWHPQRLIVEFDGKVEFDSDNSNKNRLSLNAIRLVPPAQIDWAGMPRDILHGPREVTQWAVASGAGLTAALQPLPLAADSDRSGANGHAEPTLSDRGFTNTDGALNFPGEVPMLVVPPPELDGRTDPYTAAAEAAPAGRSFQVRDVRITDGLRADDIFTVTWGLAGDEAAVDHYEVLLVRTRPEDSQPGAGALLYGDGGQKPNGQYVLADRVPRGMRSITAAPAGLADAVFDPSFTVRPLVRAVPVDASVNQANQRFGPAKAVFPRAPVRSQLTLNALFWRGRADAPPVALPGTPAAPNILSVGRSAGATTAVWQTGKVECNGVTYSGEGPASNIEVRLDDPAEQACVWLRSGVLPPTDRYRDLIAFLGFADETPGRAETRMSWYATPPGPAGVATDKWYTVVAPSVSKVHMAIPPQAAATSVTVRLEFRKSTGGPTSRPTLIGTRLVERP
jgi:hypothetical protein